MEYLLEVMLHLLIPIYGHFSRFSCVSEDLYMAQIQIMFVSIPGPVVFHVVADDLASILAAEKLAELELEPDQWDF